MNNRIKNKKMKQKFIKFFSKDDWYFYSKYPRLFATYNTYKDFTIQDVNYWYSKFINCEKSIFENLVKSIYGYVNFNKDEHDYENIYSNLEKYDFKYLMDNIEKIWRYELIPKRIRGYLYYYLKN